MVTKKRKMLSYLGFLHTGLYLRSVSVCVCSCVCITVSVFLISSYGTPLAQRASYLALHSSLFGSDGTVNYDYIVTNSISSLLNDSRCILNSAHTNHF